MAKRRYYGSRYNAVEAPFYSKNGVETVDSNYYGDMPRRSRAGYSDSNYYGDRTDSRRSGYPDTNSRAPRYPEGDYYSDRTGRHRTGTVGAAYYGDYAGRKVQEERDSRMIWEDRNAIANLPQQVMYKEWPKNQSYLMGDIDDTLFGVDLQMELDHRGMMSQFKPHKF